MHCTLLKLAIVARAMHENPQIVTSAQEARSPMRRPNQLSGKPYTVVTRLRDSASLNRLSTWIHSKWPAVGLCSIDQTLHILTVTPHPLTRLNLQITATFAPLQG